MPKQKQHRHPATPTQQDFEQDRFYYNNEEDTTEVLEVLWYNLKQGGYLEEDSRVSKFW